MAAPAAHAPHTEDPAVRGVAVILLNSYYKAGGARELTSFLVRGVHGHHYTLPMGERTHDRPAAEQARVQLDEELHLQIEAAQLRDGARFACEHVPFGDEGHDVAVFVARETGLANCSGYSRERFLLARQQCADQHKHPSYFEMDRMAHVPIAELLAPSAVQEGKVRDIDGAEMCLRDKLVLILKNEGVRARLQEARAAFAAAAGAPPPLLFAQPPEPPVSEAAAAAAADAVARAHAIYALAKGHHYTEMHDEVAAAPHAVRAQLRAFRSEHRSWTLLHLAAHAASEEAKFIVDWLGLDPRTVDGHGHTAADIAQAAGADALAAWLRAKA